MTKAAEQNKTSVMEHLCESRMEAAKVFPHCGADGAAYIKRYQGVKLSPESVRALKRG